MKKIALLQSICIFTILFSCSLISFSQDNPTKPPPALENFRVTGKVTDEANKPLEGVTVQVKGTSNYSITKRDGSFTVIAPSGNSILVFSSVGFREEEVAINNRNELNFKLTTTATTMQDVVVVGYGTQKKSDVTGALSRITDKVIQERPAQNVLQALQGKAAGVHVSSNLKPGELPILRVRGNRSLTASNDPLYVVDGIPLVNALGVNSFNMSDINPNDIASIEILKDASATAIYGSRGANGVVLITTKKGQKGKVSISYNATVSLDSYKSLTDWMNGGEFIDRWRLGLINGRQYQTTTNTNLNQPATIWYPDPFLDRDKMGLTADALAMQSVWLGYEWEQYGVTPKMRPTTAAEKALGWPDQVPVYNSKNIRSYDWMKQTVRQGVTQNHQISLSSGTDVSRLSISLSYYNQLGVQKDQDYKRYNANLTGDISPNKWLTLGTSIITSLSVQNYGILGPNTSNTGSKDLYSRATDQFPYALPKDSAGNWIRNPGGNLNLWNPLIDIDQVINERRTSAVLSSLFSEIKFTPWFKYRLNFGVQYRHFRNGAWTGPLTTNHLTNRANTAGYTTDDNFSWVVENLLYVNKTFANVHTVGVTLLQSSQKSRRESISTSVNGTSNPLSLWYDVAANSAGTPGSYGTSFTENTLSSFMGRVNYTLMDKYLLTASGRYDGSSVLAAGHKWNFFPSFALAWKMQEEGFLKGVDWITELKPRIGYGVTGNSSVQPYTTTGPLSRNPYVYGSTPGIGYLPQLVQNSLLGWEKTAQTNIGIDFTLLRSRISGSIEWYDQQTSDLIMTRTLPAPSGYVQKIENIGKTRNKGIEITLSTTNYQKGSFSWSTDLNWARNTEEIVELMNGKQDMLANGWFIGEPLQVFYQYKNAGIWGGSDKDLAEMAKFNANGHRFYPGTIKVVDQNGDYRINASDFVILGSPRPKWTGGITNTLRYKNWSLNSFAYFRWGQTYFGGFPNSYPTVKASSLFPNGRVEPNVWSWDMWKGRWPMPNSGNIENITSSMQYNDGSFWVIRNISLSYTFPKNLIKRIAVNDLVVNFQVINPFMFGGEVVRWGINPDDDTNWSIASSNTNPLGGVNNNTILPQSFVFGVRAGF
ncbi:MAG TPA: SusC/RagA family TonB-linked outer membrane protein [Chitinophagaceae bacterium]|jgi:TonB-linked SusC/RagA family outer membrane protein|nr:SusC/RagA family TonB-linked outer membrane protein [Chitinophagaceae bacterium]